MSLRIFCLTDLFDDMESLLSSSVLVTNHGKEFVFRHCLDSSVFRANN